MVYVATRSGTKESEVDLGLMMGGRIYPEDKNKRQVFEYVVSLCLARHRRTQQGKTASSQRQKLPWSILSASRAKHVRHRELHVDRRIPFPPNTNIPSAETQAAIDSQPVRAASPSAEPGPTITTVIPPNPQGDGEKAEPIVPEQDDLHASGEAAWTKPRIKELKLEFEASSDQFGRITLYQVELLG